MNIETTLVRAGRDPRYLHNVVNPPVYHASTVVFDTVAELQAAKRSDPGSMSYGRFGTPTTFCLSEAIAEIEGGFRCALFPSGLAAITVSLLAFLRSGDHLLISDSVYGPTRRFCNGMLARLGISVTFFDPAAAAEELLPLFQPNTAVVYLEAPGSMLFEMQDIPAIAAVAHARGAKVLLDNTWASPLLFAPFEHGVDVSIQAGTKYIVGHSDAMLGSVTTTQACWQALQDTAFDCGQCVGPDDAYLAHRGLRTLGVRMERHGRNGLILASWLAGQPQVERVLHPGLESDPGHALWKRDFKGASGLFGLVLKPYPEHRVNAMVEALELFSLGASWGGYESLVYPVSLAGLRAVNRPAPENPVIRLHAGLEHPDDLIADLSHALALLDADAPARRSA